MTEVIRDVLMVGTGPSALTAAIYTTREDIDTILYERATIGGLAATTDMIDNYPGFPEGVPGMELAEKFEKQVARFGAQIDFGDISSVKREDEYLVVEVDGQPVKTRSVLIATGSDYKKLGIPGEAELYGRGAHYCATCDGAFYKEKKLAVVGGGNSAVQEAIFLTRYASHIDLLVRSSVKASEVLQEDLQKYVDAGKITVHLETKPLEITEEGGRASGVIIEGPEGTQTLNVDAVFVFVGLIPNSGFLKDSDVTLDETGLVVTNERFETSMPGVFASGDVRSGAVRQVVSAAGEGAAVALTIREYIDDLKRRGL
ncbi:FAD-dependent oxidoreductase [Candidatus Saccharibacteria bacterium TM7i]|nr:FAD-dependent oxidoreductase [Candidatus Saccharibacteria bacterium TM7i]